MEKYLKQSPSAQKHLKKLRMEVQQKGFEVVDYWRKQKRKE